MSGDFTVMRCAVSVGARFDSGRLGGIAISIALLACAFTLPRVALAQSALPEQKLSTGQATHHSWPQLGASGGRVFGAWAGMDVSTADIAYGYSLDEGIDWTAEATLLLALSGNPLHMPFALSVARTGMVGMMFNQSGHYFTSRSAVDVSAWSPVVRAIVADGYYDDLESLAADADAGAIYFAYTHKMDHYVYPIRFLRSLDNGVTWSPPVVLSSPNCNGSSMVVGPDGTLYVTWVDYVLRQVLLRRSTDHGATFSPPVSAAPMLDNLNGGAAGWRVPGVSGERFYPGYQNSVSEYGSAPNFPALAVDRSNGPTRGWLYLAWADHADGTPAAAATTVREVEPNHNPIKLLADYSLAQLVPLDCDIQGNDATCCDGAVNDIDWFTFDGSAGETIVLDGESHSSNYCFANLFVALPGGERLPLSTVVFPGSNDLAAGAHPKPAIVTLPRTGPYVISAGGGSYTIRLRHWNITPGSVARDMRDIVLVRSTDGGATWSPKLRVNHDAPGADQHQPNVAVDGQGRVYVAWYDRRGTSNGNTVDAYASVSTDGGATFGPDLKLSSLASEWIRPSAESIPDWTFPGNMIGDRIALTAGDDFGMAAWTDLRAFPVASVYGARIVDIPTAVSAVSDLAAEPLASGGARLHWRVNDARGISEVEVLRREGEDHEVSLGSVAIAGSEGVATFDDATAEPGHTYTYRLRVVSVGQTGYLGPIVVALPARIIALACRNTGPNPFADRAAVTLAVPRAETGVVRVYDVQGKVVRTLAQGRFEPGERRLEWDGRDATGALAAPGLYFVSATVGGESARTKVTRMR